MVALDGLARENRLDIAKYLIDCGADVKLKRGPYSALEYVFTVGVEETEEEQFNFALFLISKGANINNSSQGNLIFRAARYNNTLMVNYLINERGVDINLTCDNGYSALMYAARNECYNVAKYLIENGARQDIVGKDGKTAKDLAIERGNEEIIALFN